MNYFKKTEDISSQVLWDVLINEQHVESDKNVTVTETMLSQVSQVSESSASKYDTPTKLIAYTSLKSGNNFEKIFQEVLMPLNSETNVEIKESERK